jgi:hypothetical protein
VRTGAVIWAVAAPDWQVPGLLVEWWQGVLVPLLREQHGTNSSAAARCLAVVSNVVLLA